MVPTHKLKELGFKEKQPGLWKKDITKTVTLYHDYRTGKRTSYAYDGEKRFPCYHLPDFKLIVRAEKQPQPRISHYVGKIPVRI